MNIIRTSDGGQFDLDNVAQTLVYNTDNTIQYIQFGYKANIYRQTFGYTGGNVTSISMWVKQ